jgi:hypothetical protein
MRSLFLGRKTIVWVLLIGATACSVDIASSGLPPALIRAASLLVLVITCVKVSMVGFEFMELRQAPILARVAFQFWAAGICIVIGIMLVTGWHT